MAEVPLLPQTPDLILLGASRYSLLDLAAITTDMLEDYRGSRAIGGVSWKVELQTLRTFFGYCISQMAHCESGKEIKTPRNLKPNESCRIPCRRRAGYWRPANKSGAASTTEAEPVMNNLRARAMIMLLRHTALRISDVCTLRKDAIS